MQEKNKETLRPVDQIVFGLDRALDEASIVGYVQRFARRPLMEALATRMSDAEIQSLVDHLGGLLRTHLTEPEYHDLFLEDPS